MAARPWPVFLLAILNLGIFAPPCDTEELRCQCIQITSELIPCEFIKTIKVIYKNIYCSRMEVIAVLKNRNAICLDPNAKWVKTLIDNIPSRIIRKDYIPEEVLYSVEFEKPLCISFVERQD